MEGFARVGEEIIGPKKLGVPGNLTRIQDRIQIREELLVRVTLEVFAPECGQNLCYFLNTFNRVPERTLRFGNIAVRITCQVKAHPPEAPRL